MLKYEKPEAQVIAFKALEENAVMGDEWTYEDKTSVFGTEEGVEYRD